MDRPNQIYQLDQLIQEVTTLARASGPTDALSIWRTRALEVLTSAFGPSHSLTEEFRALRFELNPALETWSETQFAEALQASGVTGSTQSRNTGEHFYRERLHDAKELLLVALLALRSPLP